MSFSSVPLSREAFSSSSSFWRASGCGIQGIAHKVIGEAKRIAPVLQGLRVVSVNARAPAGPPLRTSGVPYRGRTFEATFPTSAAPCPCKSHANALAREFAGGDFSGCHARGRTLTCAFQERVCAETDAGRTVGCVRFRTVLSPRELRVSVLAVTAGRCATAVVAVVWQNGCIHPPFADRFLPRTSI